MSATEDTLNCSIIITIIIIIIIISSSIITIIIIIVSYIQLKVVRNSFPFSITTELYERFTCL